MKFNIKKSSQTTKNYEGGEAYIPTHKNELLMRVLSSFAGENSFYKSGSELDAELRECIAKNDPEFVLKLAYYARHHMHLRSTPVVLMGEYALGKRRFSGAWKYIAATITRPDEITELCAYVIGQNKMRKIYTGKLPHVIKKGVAAAFGKFDEYQLAKYNRSGDITLKDAMFLTHPKRTELTDKLTNGTIKTPDTWETYISAHGSSRETWEAILPKMPYMATLRNLRNVEQHECDLRPVAAKIANKEAVLKSRQLPFRFFSAYREVGSTILMDALQDAIEVSVNNAPKFEGKTLVLVDVSASMDSRVSDKSKVNLSDIAALFGAMLHKLNPHNTDVVSFAEGFQHVTLSSRDGILTNMGKIQNVNVGYATYAHKPIEDAMAKGIKYDRIILLSDMQVYNVGGSTSFKVSLNKYKAAVNKNVLLYSFNLAQYGQLAVPEQNTVLVSGWSDNVLKFIAAYEGDKETMLKEIEATQI
jgi:hypothetical protein